MSEFGTVDSVVVVTAGSFTIGVTTAGSTVLPIGDMSDFNELGGECQFGSSTVAYTAATDVPDGTDFLTLAVALVSDVPDRTPVYVSPTVQRKDAYVILPGQTLPLRMDVPSGHLWSDSRLDPLAPSGQPVLCKYDAREDEWTVTGLPGSAPLFDPLYLDPAKPITVSGTIQLTSTGVILADDSSILASGSQTGFLDGGGPGSGGSYIDGGGP